MWLTPGEKKRLSRFRWGAALLAMSTQKLILLFALVACTPRAPVLETLGAAAGDAGEADGADLIDVGTPDDAGLPGAIDAGTPEVGLGWPDPYLTNDIRRLGRGTVVALSKLPAAQAGREVVVVLLDDHGTGRLVIVDPANSTTLLEREWPDEQAMAALGFDYLAGEPERWVLAVATVPVGGHLQLRFFDWVAATSSLLPHDLESAVSAGAPLTSVCPNWACGSQRPCPNGNECDASELCSDQWACAGGAPCAERRCVLENPNASSCGDSFAEASPSGCGCAISVQFGTTVQLQTADLDVDGKTDLIVAGSWDLAYVTYRSSDSGRPTADPGQALYQPRGCECLRAGQAPTAFTVANFGGLLDGNPEPASSRTPDLVIGTAGGFYARYGSRFPDGHVGPSCGQAVRLGEFLPVRDIAKGRFHCPSDDNASCEPYDDIVVLAATGLGSGVTGVITVISGAPYDQTDIPFLGDPLEPVALLDRPEPVDPQVVAVGDLDGNHLDDVVVFYRAVEEFHIWYGAEVGRLLGARIGQAIPRPAVDCAMQRMLLVDGNGDGLDDLVFSCATASETNFLSWFVRTP